MDMSEVEKAAFNRLRAKVIFRVAKARNKPMRCDAQFICVRVNRYFRGIKSES